MKKSSSSRGKQRITPGLECPAYASRGRSDRTSYLCALRKPESLVLVESLVRGVSVVQLVFGLSNPRQSANFPLVKPKIRARIGQNVCPIRGEFAAGERFHQGHGFQQSPQVLHGLPGVHARRVLLPLAALLRGQRELRERGVPGKRAVGHGERARSQLLPK